jgi:tetratricopeptide (TPR) repeat protein
MWGIIVTTENELINKTYYQTIIGENKQGHPIKILGEMYKEEMQKERPDLSSIRFAQGEVYFLNNDFEAAIYKWQHPLDEEFFPWAQKNIADAHLEMGLLEHAEKFYKEVDTPSIVLSSEVLLQLFSLYIQQGNQEKAVNTIKSAVKLNPDYSRVTEIAQTYFEDIKDWNSAVELAVDEAIRTKSLAWFEVIAGYAEHGVIYSYEPNYFNDMLLELLQIDLYRFESLVEVLWNSYKQSGLYIEWLESVNQLLVNLNVDQSYMWKKLPILFKDAYFELTSGRFLIRDISILVQNHLINWLNISSESDVLISSSAIIAWNETFPSVLEAGLISEAEHQFETSIPNGNDREEGVKLFESIKLWAEGEGLLGDFSEFTMPMLDEYNLEAASPLKIRNLIKASIEFLLEQRVQMEEGVQETINWNEELLAKVSDIHNQIDEMEKEKASNLINSFHQLKNTLSQKMMSKLPKILQNCSELVQEDSDFSKLHVDLNEEMNKRITAYLQNFVKYDWKHTVQEWMEECERELQESQMTCNELSGGINEQFNEVKIALTGDFKVFEDWQRDLERISRGLLRHEKVNILLRNNPSQLLLKGAGKLLGSISKNKEMLHSRYKSYIENADYTQIVGGIMIPFNQQLAFFEESIEWDVSRVFSSSLEVLKLEMEEIQEEINQQKNSLTIMQEKPEIYRDPLTMFELKLRQYELMNTIS